VFILSFFFRTWAVAGRPRFDYARLLAHSWQQALTLALLGLFTGVFWLLLFLWAQLFAAIDVDFFEDLFGEPIFIYPVTWLVLGLGLVLIRDRIRMVATVQFMCEALIKALLPLAALIVLLFLATLPATGLEPIWDTGHAAILMMMLAVVLLFFFNAVLSDDPGRVTYPLPVRLVVLAAVVVSPVSTALAAWALWLRIEQYGLSVDRLWAGVVLLLIALYTFSYAVLVLWKRGSAIAHIQTANTWLALVMAAVLLAVNAPFADLRAWAAESQTARLLDGRVDPDAFDYTYLRFSLGAYGARALERIESSELAEQDEAVRRHIAVVREKKHRWSQPSVVDPDDAAAVARMIRVIPEGEALPEALVRAVAEQQGYCLTQHERCGAPRPAESAQGPDWLVMNIRDARYGYGDAYVLLDDHWRHMGSVTRTGCTMADTDDVAEPGPLERVPGPFLASSAARCLYPVTPAAAYLNVIAGQRDARQESTPDSEKP
jgi:hypothetical protein